MKQIIRLTESDLHKLIKESATRIIKEYIDNQGNSDQYSDDIYDDVPEDWSEEDEDNLKGIQADAFDEDEENNLRDQWLDDEADNAMAFHNLEDAEPEY